MTKKTEKPSLATVMASPIFCAVFADGQTTRMSTFHSAERQTLDLARGVRLAHVAYESRMKKKPPAITEARFEDTSGKTLATYSADQLKGAVS